MLDFESRRIRDLRGIDFSKLEFEDLRWKYGTFQSVIMLSKISECCL